MLRLQKPAHPALLSHAVRLAFHGLPLMAGLQACGPLAFAEEGQTGGKVLERIVVEAQREAYQIGHTSTATKTDTPLRDVPQSITVITEGLIDDQAMQSMADVVRYVPGVQMAQGEGHRDAPILRGNTSTADFFVNGLRDDVQYFRDLYNVERVEVLKGPSGTVFGRGGSGGLINRVTRQADWTETGELSLTLGSWDNRRLTAGYDHVLGTVAAFRIDGLFEDSGAYRDFSDLERWAVNPTMTFRVSDATTLAVGYEHFEDDRVVDRGVPSASDAPLPADESTYFGQPDSSYAEARVDALTATVNHAFGNGARLVNQTRYADYDKFYQNVVPGDYDPDTSQVTITGYNNRTRRENLLNQTDLTFLARTGSTSHEFLVGIELSRQETDNFRQTGFFPDAGADATSDVVTLPDTIYTGPVEFRPSASDADNDSLARTAAIYVQDQIEFSSQWQAIVGVRYDRFETDLNNRRNGTSLSSTDDLISPRAGLIYKPRQEVSLYASYTVAYVPRAGEQLASLTATNRALDPEEFTNREVGVKWDLNERLSATAALYRLDRTNVAITDPNDPARSLLVDGQRVQGVELSLAGQVTEDWQVMAGYAYQDSEVETPGVLEGNELGQVPKHSLSLWNRYDLTPRWGVGLGAIYQGDVYVSADNAVVLPGFTRMDAAVYYTLRPSLRFQLNVENLLDEEYYASAHSNNNILPGSPRAIRLGINLRL